MKTYFKYGDHHNHNEDLFKQMKAYFKILLHNFSWYGIATLFETMKKQNMIWILPY